MTDTDESGPTETTEEPFRLSGPWGRHAVKTFLDETVVPIRLSCRTPSGGLWMLSLWFLYRDEALWCATGADADIVSFLEADPHVAFEVSVNDPPYRGVRGQGTVTLEPDPQKDLLRDLIERYLGGTESNLATRLLSADREETTIRIDPTRVATWDYTDRMADTSD